MSAPDLVRLSKTVSHALRHQPDRYGLNLDKEGWVPVAELLAALHRRWPGLSEADLAAMMAAGDKQRFEMEGGRIRARYGHSGPNRVVLETAIPPPFLYHGTTRRNLAAIRHDGLRPMRRQFVHLAADIPTALATSQRRPGPHVLLAVDTRAAHDAGVPFYRGNTDIWLAGPIPPAFIASEGENR